jgi:purine-binding chemotaxis protein CheW
MDESPDRGKEFIPRAGPRRTADVGPPGSVERRVAKADRRHDNNRMYATFFIEDHFFGIEVEKVQEVFTAQEITPVPLAPPVIAGLINLRGEIVTALDLRNRLGFPPRPAGMEAMSVVVRTAEGSVNLLVDQIGDVIEVLPTLFEPPPETVDPQMAAVLDGVYKLEERLFLALNIQAIVHGFLSTTGKIESSER